ncbi:hypothetical protein BCAR13_410036 [Paraburkholderia caribensis]|nr:hypothetical protein BCAR13_410036 [Paraburkholderia caribensis]
MNLTGPDTVAFRSPTDVAIHIMFHGGFDGPWTSKNDRRNHQTMVSRGAWVGGWTCL